MLGFWEKLDRNFSDNVIVDFENLLFLLQGELGELFGDQRDGGHGLQRWLGQPSADPHQLLHRTFRPGRPHLLWTDLLV